MEMSKYVRLTKGLQDKGILVEASKFHEYINTSEQDWYVSIYQYNEEQKKQFKLKGTVSGIEEVVTNKLVFDFDSKSNLDLAKTDTLQLIERLNKYNINTDSIELYFSGNKGFTVVVEFNRNLTPKEVKHIAVVKLGRGLSTLDTSIYNASRILRVPGTKHQVSGLYKIPLTLEELKTLNQEQIKQKATSLDNIPEEVSIRTAEPNEELFKIEEILETTKVEQTLDFDIKNFDMSNKPSNIDEARWLLMNGFFRGSQTSDIGERSNAFLCLASTYKNQGYDKAHVYRLLKGVAELQADRTGEIRYPDKELWYNVILQVYGDNWRGGQFSIKDETSWLHQYAKRMGMLEKSISQLMTITDVKHGYVDFVKNIDKNTILTGIEDLDRMMPMTTGSNIGIVAPPSVGKCLGKDTPILMFDGSIKMVQDVKVGDLLMGDDSTARTVLNVVTGKETLYKVNQSYGDDYIVNSSHILSLKKCKEEGSSQKGTIIDMNVEDYLNSTQNFKKTYKGYKVPVEFSSNDLKLDPYFLGVWLGDGTVKKPEVTNLDKEIREYLKFYSQEINVNYRERFSKNVSTLVMTTEREKVNPLLEKLKEYDLINNKHIPNDFIFTNRENRLKLLAGLIDSGYLDKSTLNKTLSNQIVFLARSLGLKCTIKEVQKYSMYKGEKKLETYYKIYIKHSDLSIIPTKVKRKQPKNVNNKKDYLSSSLKIENIGVGDYYGFEIDGNKRFLLGDFTVTHNTSIALEILKNVSQSGNHAVFASLDMHRNRLFEKLLYKVTGVKRDELYKLIQTDQYDTLIDKVKDSYENIWFYDRSSPSVSDIRNYIINIEKTTGNKVKLLMVDYFERVGSEYSDDTAASKKVAGELQDLLNDMNIAIITLYQPNKFSIGSGPDQEIQSYTAIKGSSFIAQACRGIISLSRPFFHPKTTQYDKYLRMSILKNDLGEIGTLDFKWDGFKGEISKMDDYELEGFYKLLSQKKSMISDEDEGDSDGWK